MVTPAPMAISVAWPISPKPVTSVQAVAPHSVMIAAARAFS